MCTQDFAFRNGRYYYVFRAVLKNEKKKRITTIKTKKTSYPWPAAADRIMFKKPYRVHIYGIKERERERETAIFPLKNNNNILNTITSFHLAKKKKNNSARVYTIIYILFARGLGEKKLPYNGRFVLSMLMIMMKAPRIYTTLSLRKADFFFRLTTPV